MKDLNRSYIGILRHANKSKGLFYGDSREMQMH